MDPSPMPGPTHASESLSTCPSRAFAFGLVRRTIGDSCVSRSLTLRLTLVATPTLQDPTSSQASRGSLMQAGGARPAGGTRTILSCCSLAGRRLTVRHAAAARSESPLSQASGLYLTQHGRDLLGLPSQDSDLESGLASLRLVCQGQVPLALRLSVGSVSLNRRAAAAAAPVSDFNFKLHSLANLNRVYLAAASGPGGPSGPSL
jgi:hypothetical protein